LSDNIASSVSRAEVLGKRDDGCSSLLLLQSLLLLLEEVLVTVTLTNGGLPSDDTAVDESSR
jgi:hypothetical protein